VTQKVGWTQKVKPKSTMHQGQNWDFGWLGGVILDKYKAWQSFLCKQRTDPCMLVPDVCRCWFCSLTRKGREAFSIKSRSLCNVSCQHLWLGQSATHVLPQCPTPIPSCVDSCTTIPLAQVGREQNELVNSQPWVLYQSFRVVRWGEISLWKGDRAWKSSRSTHSAAYCQSL
jgi:hypothetical protein